MHKIIVNCVAYFKNGVIIDNLRKESTDKRITSTGGVYGFDLEGFHHSTEILYL